MTDDMPSALAARGALVIRRSFGLVVLTRLGQNDEAFRKAALRWLATAPGRTWLAQPGHVLTVPSST